MTRAAEASSDSVSDTVRATRRRAGFWPPLVGGLAVGALTAAGAWYALPVQHIEVTGASHLSAARVRELAGVSEGFGWLFYGPWRASALAAEPWVASATIVRQYPATVRIEVVERVAAARWQHDGREDVIARDGTVLPGARPAGSLVRGWGPSRLGEALQVSGALRTLGVTEVTYDPYGLTARTAAGLVVWTGSVAALRRHGGNLAALEAERVNIYPWGLSVRR